MVFRFDPITDAEARSVNAWRWRDVVFNSPSLTSRTNTYAAHDETGAVVAYCSFGPIPELDPDRYMGVAGGLRPDLVGRGNGRAFMEALLALGRQTFPTKVLAGVVKKSNQRSMHSVLRAGFVVLRDADDDGEGEIVVDPTPPTTAS